jgi:hypothetical protein
MAPFHTRNSVHTNPNGVQITAEFFHRKSNPAKIVGISESVAGNPDNPVTCGNLRRRPVSSRSIVAPATHDRLVRRAAQSRARRVNAKSVARQGFCG